MSTYQKSTAWPSGSFKMNTRWQIYNPEGYHPQSRGSASQTLSIKRDLNNLNTQNKTSFSIKKKKAEKKANWSCNCFLHTPSTRKVNFLKKENPSDGSVNWRKSDRINAHACIIVCTLPQRQHNANATQAVKGALFAFVLYLCKQWCSGGRFCRCSTGEC